MLFFLMFSIFFLIPRMVVRCVQDGCSSDSVEKMIVSLINLFMIFLILYFIGHDDIFYLSIFIIMISMLCDISDICDDDYNYNYDGKEYNERHDSGSDNTYSNDYDGDSGGDGGDGGGGDGGGG